ncbi:PrsW family intramembrane metalloprotease, partial [Candidatus Woesearchaeota archaeon]|nr:PrsW family intramembrane metalloprotease [Candidatus Woesearchaeota archaeon]
SIVVLTFFSGCLSTAPILFYDAVVKNGYELHFFLFRITPESFMNSSRTFVGQALTGTSGILSASVAVTVVSFVLVGVIEEWSKHWVTRKSDPAYFSSINDVIQLSIIAAIGFAFAENVVNPNYFLAFVKNFLVSTASPDWGMFLGSVFGRSIITNMVHITCSGVLGYFYGLAFFAKPALEDDRAHGRRHLFILFLHRFTGASRIQLYR